MDARDKRPRHHAVDLVDAWVRGDSPAQILARLSEADRQLASAHARAFCEQIQFHRRAGTPVEQIKGTQMAAWIQAYTARISRK